MTHCFWNSWNFFFSDPLPPLLEISNFFFNPSLINYFVSRLRGSHLDNGKRLWKLECSCCWMEVMVWHVKARGLSTFSFDASHPQSDSTTDRPLFDVKWPDLIGRAGGQVMFFCNSFIGRALAKLGRVLAINLMLFKFKNSNVVC